MANESPANPVTRSLREVADKIEDASLLLFRRGGGPVHACISKFGGSRYVHSAMAGHWDKDVMCIETLQYKDARAVTLASQVAANPGRYDVFRVEAFGRPFSRMRAVAQMRRFCGLSYGWYNLMRIAARKLPVLRLFVATVEDDHANGRMRYPPFCSMACAMAYEYGGIDPVPNCPPWLVQPADLARSMLFKYEFTLVP